MSNVEVTTVAGFIDEAAAPTPRPGMTEASDFEAFYRREFDWARRLAFVLVYDAGVADEVAQESFARLHGRYDELDKPRAYLRATVVNLARRRVRLESRHRQAVLDVEQCTVSSPSLEILELVNQLPERQRAVLVLRYFEDLSEREIAEVLSCRPGTVKSLASRALRQLRKELDA